MANTIFDKFYGTDDLGNRAKRWSGLPTRVGKKILNNLGIIDAGSGTASSVKLHRDRKLAVLQAYYENAQFDHLNPWDLNCGEDYKKVRSRKPRIMVPFAKTLASRITAKLVGEDTFPTIRVENDPDSTEFYQLVSKAVGFPSMLAEPIRLMCGMGASLLRFWIVDGTMKLEQHNANYCYPEFNEDGSLRFVRIQYVYYSPEEYDDTGAQVRRWYRLDLGEESEILYDNPIYDPVAQAEPAFEVVDREDHNLGFVQATWFRTSENPHTPDGFSLHEDIMPFIDELCYSLSQSSQAISYNQDPQLVISGKDTESIEELIRSASRAWSLGPEGKAAFLESNLGGVATAKESREEIKQYAMDAARIVFLDPEKMATHAQSAAAMKVLYGAMIELVNEIRPHVAKGLKEALFKMGLIILSCNARGMETPLVLPPGFVPASMGIEFDWPPVIPLTTQDLQALATLVTTLANGNIFSRETMTRFLAPHFNIEDIEAELAKIKSQPVLNPFGGSYFG